MYKSNIYGTIIRCYQKFCITNCVKRHIKTWKVMFFGSDDFALVSLEALYGSLGKTIETLEVVSLKAKSSNLIYDFGMKNNLKHHVWKPNLTDNYDIGIVVSFGKLIPESIINYFPLGIINLHPSLIPQYRGGMPIYHAIKNGETETGVTIMKIKPYKFDTGDIIMQVKCKIGEHEVMPYLRKKLAHLGAKCLLQTINDLPQCLDKSVPQISVKASSAPIITKEEANVQWDKMTAQQVYNIYRGLFGQYNLNTTWEIFTISFYCIFLEPPRKSNFISNTYYNQSPGSIEYCEECELLRVYCTDKPLYICTMRFKNRILLASQFYRSLKRMGKKSYIFK